MGKRLNYTQYMAATAIMESDTWSDESDPTGYTGYVAWVEDHIPAPQRRAVYEEIVRRLESNLASRNRRSKRYYNAHKERLNKAMTKYHEEHFEEMRIARRKAYLRSIGKLPKLKPGKYKSLLKYLNQDMVKAAIFPGISGKEKIDLGVNTENKNQTQVSNANNKGKQVDC